MSLPTMDLGSIIKTKNFFLPEGQIVLGQWAKPSTPQELEESLCIDLDLDLYSRPWPKAKEGLVEGQKRPRTKVKALPQELEVSPRSGLYL